MRYAFVLALGLGGPGDRWFGPDKVKHFFMSAFVQTTTFAAVRAAGANHATSIWSATAATAAFGVGKEVLDRNVAGDFSARDLVYDAAGALSATALLNHTDRSTR